MPSTQTIENIKTLKDFIGANQLHVIAHGTRGEEKEFFIDKLAEMANTVNEMPKTYETEGTSMDDKTITLHYFTPNADWYIIEKDMGDGSDDTTQYEAFGVADIGMGLSGGGYISIDEIVNKYGAELDLHWTPCTVAELKAK
jgi:hypothetical protein